MENNQNKIVWQTREGKYEAWIEDVNRKYEISIFHDEGDFNDLVNGKKKDLIRIARKIKKIKLLLESKGIELFAECTPNSAHHALKNGIQTFRDEYFPKKEFEKIGLAVGQDNEIKLKG